MTVSQVVSMLKGLENQGALLSFEQDGEMQYFWGEFGSYRGNYFDMYTGYDSDKSYAMTVKEFTDSLNAFMQNNEMMEGYKGGSYPVEYSCKLYVDYDGGYQGNEFSQVTYNETTNTYLLNF